jgi:hypothetical protein
MNKILKYLSFVYIIFILLNVTNVSAENKDVKVEFDGKVVATREFYVGEYASYFDFKVNGSFVTNYGELIDSKDWKVFAITPVSSSYVDITIKHIPSLSEDKPIYNDIKYRVKVKSSNFNSDLKLKVSKTIYTKETDLSKIFNDSDFVFKNSLGKVIDGNLNYDKIELNYGVNYINYTFTPDKKLITSYGYEEYKTMKDVIKIIVSK